MKLWVVLGVVLVVAMVHATSRKIEIEIEGNPMSIINNIIKSESKLVDMQATVRWFRDSKEGHYIDYEWAYKDGMEYRETHNNNDWTEIDTPVWPIEILTYDGKKQFAYTSTLDKSNQRGGIYGFNPIPFEASLMPRCLMGYSLLDTLGDRLKKADEVSCIEQNEVIRNSICFVIEAKNISISDNCIEHYKAWVDIERDYRPLKIEIYQNTNARNPWESLIRRIDNITLQKIDGIWYPTSGDIQYYRDSYVLTEDGRDVKTLSAEEQNKIFGALTDEQAKKLVRKQSAKRGPVQHIEVSNIRLNQGVEDGRFSIDFPNGCAVWDDFIQHGYVVEPQKPTS